MLSCRLVAAVMVGLVPVIVAPPRHVEADSIPPVLDRSFGSTSPRSASFELHDGRTGQVTSVLPLPDGRTLVGGKLLGEVGGIGFWAARLLSNGSLDRTYGTNGITQVQTFSGIPFAYSAYNATMIVVDGRLVVAAEAEAASASVYGLTVDGQLDLSFGDPMTPGHVELAGWRTVQGTKLVMDSHHRLYVVVTDNFVWSQGFAVIRMSRTGVVDTTYPAGGGVHWLATSVYSPTHASAAMTPDDRLILFYQGVGIESGYLSVTRLLDDGTTDPTFAPTTSGIRRTFVSGELPVDVDVQQDGSIIVVGSRTLMPSGENLTTVQRLRNDGADAEVWGPSTPLMLSRFGGGVTVNDDGTIMLFGSAVNDGEVDRYHVEMRRYLPSGQLDPTFNPTSTTPGVAMVFLTSRNVYVATAAVDQQRRIIVGGGVSVGAFATAPWLARFLPGEPAALPYESLVPSRLLDTPWAGSPPTGSSLVSVPGPVAR